MCISLFPWHQSLFIQHRQTKCLCYSNNETYKIDSLTVIPYSMVGFDVTTAVMADVSEPTMSEFKIGPTSIQKIPINLPKNDLGVISPYLNEKGEST